MDTRAKFIMVGGFLGAGKTTALAQLARHLHAKGKRVGLITNDQAEGLVDTLNLKSQGFAVEEIAGGCFCCRFQSLTEAADRLAASERPEIFLGEPVGSCTDLIATVGIPMQKLYGNRFDVAPLTVLVDPLRAWKILTHQQRAGFSPQVAYIYRKQLEEADAVAINKIDLLPAGEQEKLRQQIEEQFHGKRLFTLSAKSGDGLQPWFEYVATEEKNWMQPLELDYDQYAAGEAELGWLNGSLVVHANQGFDPDRLLSDIAQSVRQKMTQQGAEIAHLKMTLASGSEIGLLSLVRNDAIPELGRAIGQVLQDGEITLNGRGQIDPEILQRFSEEAIREACGSQDISYKFLHILAFRPPRPRPVHRMQGLSPA